MVSPPEDGGSTVRSCSQCQRARGELQHSEPSHSCRMGQHGSCGNVGGGDRHQVQEQREAAGEVGLFAARICWAPALIGTNKLMNDPRYAWGSPAQEGDEQLT